MVCVSRSPFHHKFQLPRIFREKPGTLPCIEREGVGIGVSPTLGCIMQSLESAICLCPLCTFPPPRPPPTATRIVTRLQTNIPPARSPVLTLCCTDRTALQSLMLSRAASISHRIWDWKEFKVIFDEQVRTSSRGGGYVEMRSEIKLRRRRR